MKLWQKTCMYSLFLFLLVFFCSGILMIEHNKKIALDRTLQRATDEHNSISVGIIRYVMLNRARDSSKNGFLDPEYITEYLNNRMNTAGIYIKIQEKGEEIYNNLGFELTTASEMIGIHPEYHIQSKENKTYLMLSSRIPLKNRELDSFYIMDISYLYMDRMQQYSFFMKLAFLVSVLLFGGMYVITGHLTKSLRILTKSVERIGTGDYHERVTIQTKDEIGTLAERYNKMIQAIEKNIQQLEKKTKEQQRFIDNFTHELRTPLTAVVGYADLLRSTSYEETFSQELGERIFKEGKRIERLSEAMMDLIFVERHSFSLIPCEIGQLLTDAKNQLKPVMEQDQIHLCCILPKHPVMILAEKGLFLNLVSNLADNARKASVKGGNIWIRGRKEGEYAVIEVEDRGKGISPEEKEKIFEPFYMVDTVRNKKNTGIGLGLSICADIIKIHHAQIHLESERGKGTLIQIRFPCYK